MRIGILSDTHNEVARTRLAVQLLQREGAEALFHCGDVTGRDVVLECAALPSHFVFGNHDSDNVPELRRAIEEIKGICLEWGGEVTLAGKRIAIAHGHLHIDIRRLMAAGPDYLFSGHSHQPSDRAMDKVRRINPGALSDADVFTVAILHLATDELRYLEVTKTT